MTLIKNLNWKKKLHFLGNPVGFLNADSRLHYLYNRLPLTPPTSARKLGFFKRSPLFLNLFSFRN